MLVFVKLFKAMAVALESHAHFLDAFHLLRVMQHLRGSFLCCTLFNRYGSHVEPVRCDCRSWLERQQNCPTCRASVLAPPPASQAPAAQAQGAEPAADGAAPQNRVRTFNFY